MIRLPEFIQNMICMVYQRPSSIDLWLLAALDNLEEQILHCFKLVHRVSLLGALLAKQSFVRVAEQSLLLPTSITR